MMESSLLRWLATDVSEYPPTGSTSEIATFCYRGLSRNPEMSGPLGVREHEPRHGLRRPGLLDLYRTTMELAYRQFRKRGLAPAPTGADGRIPVFLCDTGDPRHVLQSPCMNFKIFRESSGRVEARPVLVLRSRFDAPTLEAEEAQAQSDAVHELRHWFNAAVLPLVKIDPRRTPSQQMAPGIDEWVWLDEALCIMAEEDLLEGNKEWLRYMIDWSDCTGEALDAKYAQYQSAIFTRYVQRLMEKRNRPYFLDDVWRRSATVWTCHENPHAGAPHTALSALAAELAAEKLVLASSNPEVPDVFAHGFCFDSYFLDDPVTPAYQPEVFKRFGGRAVTCSWSLNGSQHANHSHDSSLSGLACHYFRVFPATASRTLEVRVECSHQDAELRVEVALVPTSQQRPRPEFRWPCHRVGNTWSCKITAFNSSDAHHALIIVSGVTIAWPQQASLRSIDFKVSVAS